MCACVCVGTSHSSEKGEMVSHGERIKKQKNGRSKAQLSSSFRSINNKGKEKFLGKEAKTGRNLQY